ncbi:MAG: hypothetical protein Q9196_003499 [Gyalolechia fulgens]
MATTGIRAQHARRISSPEFIDSASCRCALQSIAAEAAETAIDPENIQVWRCRAHATQNIDQDLSGQWYFPHSQKIQVTGLRDETVDGYLLPDTTTCFTAEQVDHSLRIRFLHSTQPTPPDDQCTGLLPYPAESVPHQSSSSLRIQRDVSDPSNNAPVDRRQSPCHGGSQAVAVPIQDPESWQRVGCLPGFLCELIPFRQRNPESKTVCGKAQIIQSTFCPRTALQTNAVKSPGSPAVNVRRRAYSSPSCVKPVITVPSVASPNTRVRPDTTAQRALTNQHRVAQARPVRKGRRETCLSYRQL